jgi:ferrous iron transport protein B
MLTGILAKETMVSTFEVVLGGAALSALFTPQSAYAFMAFTLLSSPCIAAISAMKKELGNTKEMWKAIAFQCGVAYTVALIINQAGNLLAAVI